MFSDRAASSICRISLQRSNGLLHLFVEISEASLCISMLSHKMLWTVSLAHDAQLFGPGRGCFD
jgi:hypothetical protein